MKYAKELSRYCVDNAPNKVTKKKVQAIIKKAINNDNQARATLLALYGRMIIKYATKSARSLGADVDDYIQVGVEEMFLCLKKYDTTRGQFSTFLYYRLKRAFGLHHWKDFKVNMGYDSFCDLNRVAQAREKTSNDTAQISKYTNIPERRVNNLIPLLANPTLLEGELTAVDSVEECVIKQEASEEMTSLFSILTSQERDVILGFYGVDCERLTLQELATKHGKSVRWVCYVKSRGLEKIRDCISEHKDDYAALL